MSFETAVFLGLMPVTVTITPFRRYSTDGYTIPTYSTAQAVNYRARVAFSKHLDTAPDGRSVTPVHVAWLATTTLIDVRSKFTYLGTTYRMIRSERFMDDTGIHHTRLSFHGG